MFTFFANTSFSEPIEMLKALDISRIVNLMFARIISLIFDMFLAVVEVDGRPDHDFIQNLSDQTNMLLHCGIMGYDTLYL
jgi:hypothetical protein